MPEVPKIVRERLRGRAGMPAPHMPDAHPNADLLNAFAEQAVLPAEREQILQHLAVCEDCRSVLLVALPAMESAAPAVAVEAASQSAVARAPGRGWFSRPLFTWPNLSWAALAAGVIVAGAFFMNQPAKQAQPVAEKQSPAAISQPASTTQPPQTAANTVAGQQKSIAEQPGRQLELARNAGLQTGLAVARKEAALKSESKKADGQNEKDMVTASASPAPQAPAPVSRLDAAAANEPAIADKTSTDNLVASKEEPVPVRRSKPATAEEQGTLAQSRAKVAPTLMAKTAGALVGQAQLAPQWTISAGILRRSLDGGTTWQTALPDAYLLSYAVHESDVWAGGKSGLLFHSADGGMTWTQVHPAIGDRSLSNDVTSMQMIGASEVVLSTSNGEIWTSLDNGKTWSTQSR